MRSEIGDRAITLDWRDDSGDLGGRHLTCTCPHLHQIVMNLVRNAIAATPEDGRLSVWTRHQDDRLVIEVADTGPGLDETAQSQLFEPFYTTSPEGSGLGLWITYQLVKNMGGRIRVDSAPQAGAKFTVTLPLTAMVALPCADDAAKQAAQKGTTRAA